MAAEKPIAPVVDRPVRRLLGPLRRFLRVESASGLVLLACTIAALYLANSRHADAYFRFWHAPVGIRVADFEFVRPLEFWVNDALMVVFFFVVGLEIKRELVHGELNEWRKAALPAIAAAGGMIVPALVYAGLIRGGPGSQGWGIPMATDIAFVVGILAIFRSAPVSLKVFLLALAIADDIGAVLVIALAYTRDLAPLWLYWGLGGIGLVILMNGVGVRWVPAYLAVGAAVWVAFLAADVHPTVAGVLLGLLTPTRPLVSLPVLREHAVSTLDAPDVEEDLSERRHALLESLAWASQEAVSPLDRLMRAWHPAASFLIIPVFALANAGVPFDGSRVTQPVAWAVLLGLFVGKPLGIVGACALAVRLRIARLPQSATWPMLAGAGILGGIGFTMSIFIAGLALPDELLAAGKSGIIVGSATSALVGSAVLLFALRCRPQSAASAVK